MQARKRHGRWFEFMLCLLCAANALAANEPEQYSEDALKAAYLYRFTGYIEWPEELEHSATFTIAVLGASGVTDQLERLLAAQPIKNRPARVHRIDTITELGDAHVLYIGAGYSTSMVRKLIAPIAKRPVLVVTEDARGLEMGGTINFVRADRRVRFEVSLTGARTRGLNISSDLLAVALRVQGAALESALPCDAEKVEAHAPCPQQDARR